MDQPFKFNIPENVVVAIGALHYPTAARLYLASVKRKERAVCRLEAKQRFLNDTCAALGVSENQLTYESLKTALQANA
ncbi:hypothetical protein LTR10_014946 [Elasticomyces elasticus]|nr:hypothetical protein LTR10_014946 [Elasticomyces elasticus]KAK4964523.1 hypothetical protein LTR42_012819 [Elasticomyces elasticus]